MPKHARPILDTETGKEYASMYKAGQELAGTVGGDPKDRLVWFAVARAFPTRFKTKDPETGEWIPLKAAARKPRAENAREKKAVEAQPAPTATVTTLEPATAKLAVAPQVVAKTKTRPKSMRATTGSITATTRKTAPKKSRAAKTAKGGRSSR